MKFIAIYRNNDCDDVQQCNQRLPQLNNIHFLICLQQKLIRNRKKVLYKQSKWQNHSQRSHIKPRKALFDNNRIKVLLNYYLQTANKPTADHSIAIHRRLDSFSLIFYLLLILWVKTELHQSLPLITSGFQLLRSLSANKYFCWTSRAVKTL